MLPGLLDEGEGVLQSRLGAFKISRRQQRFGKIAYGDGASGIST